MCSVNWSEIFDVRINGNLKWIWGYFILWRYLSGIRRYLFYWELCVWLSIQEIVIIFIIIVTAVNNSEEHIITNKSSNDDHKRIITIIRYKNKPIWQSSANFYDNSFDYHRKWHSLSFHFPHFTVVTQYHLLCSLSSPHFTITSLFTVITFLTSLFIILLLSSLSSPHFTVISLSSFHFHDFAIITSLPLSFHEINFITSSSL